MSAATLVTQLLNGVSLIAILILVALGLAIIFGLMGVINMAHGELFTIGAYALVAVSNLGGFWAGVLLAPVVGAVVGIALERGVVQFLYTRPIETILATWGISLILQQGIEFIFGTAPQAVPNPFPGAISVFGIVDYPVYRLFILMAGVVITAATFFVFLRTEFGLMARAVIQNREIAAAIGINTDRIYVVAFALGAALAALAGALMAPLINVLPLMGVSFLARSFFVVIVGGAGNLLGVVGGSVLIGGLETLFSSLWSVTLAQALVLVIAIVIVRFRPTGLFAG
ncbi:MAG: branched-chain amino acid transporter permease [Thermomicrobiales bacterium]|nr:branched-chain amino acid transporter permease [Thermomicrobiales bacterium]